MRKFIASICILILAVLLIFTWTFYKKDFDVVNKPIETFNITFDKELLHSNLYPPDKLQIHKIAKNSIELTWDFKNTNLSVPSGMAKEYALHSGFRIYRDGNWLIDLPKTQTSYTDFGLYPEDRYIYSISALTFDNKIEGIKSKTITAKTLPGSKNPISFPKKKINIYLAEGDSITEYETIGQNSSYVTIIGNFLRQKNQAVKIINKGVTNSFSATVNERIANELMELQPDLVTIAIGTNDLIGMSRDIGNISMDEYRNNLRGILKTSQGSNRSVVLINIYLLECCIERINAWNKIARDVANENNVLYIDVASVMESQVKSYYDGGIHPNFKGHIVIGNTVINSLKPYLD